MKPILTKAAALIFLILFFVDWFIAQPGEKRIESGVYWLVILVFLGITTRETPDTDSE